MRVGRRTARAIIEWDMTDTHPLSSIPGAFLDIWPPLEARRFADTVVTGAAADGRVTHVSLSTDDGVRFGLPGAPQTTDRSASRPSRRR